MTPISKLGVTMMLLWPAAILFVAGGASPSLDCNHETNTCITVNWFMGMAVKRKEFQASEFTDALIQGRSIGNARGLGTRGAYYVLLGSPTGRTYATQSYDSRDTPALLQQLAEAEAFITKERSHFSDGPRYAWLVLLPGFLLFGAAAYLGILALTNRRKCAEKIKQPVCDR
jgi:hypothetical protein